MFDFCSFLPERAFPVEFYRFDGDPGASSPSPKYFVNGYSAGLMHDTVKAAGFVKTEELSEAKLIIGSNNEDNDIYTRLAASQRVTHFEHTRVVGLKLGLHHLMNRFAKRFGFLPEFYPKTFVVPQEKEEFCSEFKESDMWIEKPARGSCGRGIRIINRVPDEFDDGVFVMQRYIRNPLLIRGMKFDLRFYVAVQSISPLRIYVYSDGLVRLASEPYCLHFDDPEALCAHLTNFAINKESPEFKVTDNINEDGKGNKWSHAPFWPMMEALNYDVEKMKHDIDDAIVTVLMCAREGLIMQPHHRNSFELYGFDILVDVDGGIHLLEVNISPALGRSSQLDIHVKAPLVRDWLTMALIPKDSAFSERLESAFTDPQKQDLASFIAIAELELADRRLGGFRRIYPTPERIRTHHKYLPFPTPLDISVAKYMLMSDTKKQSYVRKMVPVLDEFVEDLLNCTPGISSCAVC